MSSQVPLRDERGGELGSRSKPGAAPATVVEFKSQRETTGPQAWEGVATVRKDTPEPGNQPEVIELD